MNLALQIQEGITQALQSLYQAEVEIQDIGLQPTRKEFAGTYTFVTFPYSRISKKKPEETAEEIGQHLVANSEVVEGFNVVKGFLNLELNPAVWSQLLNNLISDQSLENPTANGRSIMVEYSSPNTNKPLHLGHLRNNFLGYSVAKIYEALGFKVVKVQIINDRGIHICKSMVAWMKMGNGETPESSGLKGDKLVGKYYVEFDKAYKAQIQELVDQGKTKEAAEKQAPILLEAQDLLRKWEAKDIEVYALWQKMNGWVYKGFEETYRQMGVTFDQLYYESDTYLLGKDQVEEGLKNGHFFKKDDGSVWIDLTDDGLDEKIVQRSDGTAVYMTQDIGTAIKRYNDHPGLERQVYTVGNEQDYHFKVLFKILEKLGYDWAKDCYHLSYGMVDLPSGKMKSREGTVVDADDLMIEMIDTAESHTRELGKIEGFSKEQAKELYDTLGLGALKYFLLKVDPKKRMLFDPQESIEFQGNTGPFIQYTHARISAILRRAKESDVEYGGVASGISVDNVEADLIYQLADFKSKIELSAQEYSPSVIAQYVYDLAKEYNKFYAEKPIFGDDDAQVVQFRVALSAQVARNLKYGMSLLGIHVPDRM